jgi:serine protease Do
MKLHWTWIIAMALAIGGWYVQPRTLAGDKKEEPKQERVKDTVVNDALTNADLKDKARTGSFCKTYTYKMTEGRKYQIDMVSGAFDSYLRLENPKGDQVAADDDGGGFPSARILYEAPTTGDFTICATTFGGGSTGKFMLTVKDVTVGEPKKKAAAKSTELKLDKGAAKHDGKLEATDAKYQGQKLAKVYLVKLEEGKSYQIDHVSQAFDAYLYLEGPDGKILAQDDDGGNGLNSRIVHKAAATGNYRIIATSLGGTATGDYSLSIQATDSK